MNRSPPYLPAAETAAVPAEDMPDVGRVRWCGTPVEQLFPDRDLLLYPLELLPADNAGVVVLHIVFGLLAPVLHLPDGKGVGGAGLVPVRIPSVETVGQDVADRALIPHFLPVLTGNPQLIQLLGNICPPPAPECQPEDLPHHLGLLGDDFRIQPVQPVAVGHGGGGEDPLLHPHPDAGAHIAGVGGGLHLGESRVNGGGLLGGQLPGVHILLLEADGDAQPQQLPHKVQGVLGVPGEPGDGLDQDAVDFSGPAVRHHPVELVPLPGAQAGNALVRVDVGQLPVRVLPDMAGVVVHLGQIGVELVG